MKVTNYFTLFTLPESFTLDETALHRAYTQLQQQCHPDRMVGKDDRERAKAIQQSMDANEGYEVLKSPLNRAQHLLALQGVIINSEANDTVNPSPELLMESMEMREQLEGCANERDVALMVKDVKKASLQCQADVEQAFSAKKYEEAAQHTLRLRYLAKVIEEAYMRQYQMKEA